MNNNERFLNLYREYETALRQQGIEYKNVEDESDEALAGRLRICRQMRNFLTHQDDKNFLTISDSQVRFMEQQAADAKMMGDVLKKHLRTIRTSCVKEDDLLSDAIRKINRLHTTVVPVEEDHIITGMIDIHRAADTYMNAARPSKVKVRQAEGRLKDVEFICLTPETPMSEVQNIILFERPQIIVCTDDGTEKGRILGVYVPDSKK